MAHSALVGNQEREVRLAIARDCMDMGSLVKGYAGRILTTADIAARDRMWLHDVKRDRVNMGHVVRLLELAACAQLRDALYGPEVFRGALLRQLKPAIPCWSLASQDEETTNHLGNVAQLEWAERRSRSAAEMVIESMTGQVVASRILADAVHVAAVNR